MKSVEKIMAVLCILVLLAARAPAWGDIRFGATGRTRDILLFEEEDEVVLVEIQIHEMSNHDFVTSLTPDREESVYSSGDRIVFTFKAEEDSYITILNFTPSGQIVVLFPNQWVEDNYVRAGEEVRIPTEGQGFSMRAGNVVGVDVVKAVATNKDVKVFNRDDSRLVGPFAVLQDATKTRDILLFAEDDPSDDDDPLKWSVSSLAIMTQGGSDEPTGFAVAQNATNSAYARMWADKAGYLIGSQVFLKFMSDKPATLTSLVNIGASTAENNLLPEGEKITVNPGEILILPRSNDKWKLVAASDTGVDVIKGILTFEDGSQMELSFKVLVENDE